MIGKIADNHEKFKNTEFYLISNESDSKLQEIAKEFKLQKYLNIKIGRDSKNIFFDKFKVKGVPYFAIFGSDKKVKLDFSGTIEPDELYSVITN
jgi:hypothetical protein